MKHLSSHVIIVSSSKETLPVTENAKRHKELTGYLRMLSVPFEEVIGLYDGVIEHSVMLNGDNQQVAAMIVRDYEQMCYLEHHNDRTCELVYPDWSRKKIGTMREVTEQEAKKKNNWTQTKDKRFFVAE